MSSLGEVRCRICAERRGVYGRILFRFRIGSLAPGGEIVVRCRDCKCDVRLTTGNQEPDGVTTFPVVPDRSGVAIPVRRV